MPSSSDRQRDLMRKWFGSIDIFGPLNFLFSRGYKEKGGNIMPPVFSHSVSSEEWECIQFLFEEWDFSYDQSRTPTNA